MKKIKQVILIGVLLLLGIGKLGDRFSSFQSMAAEEGKLYPAPLFQLKDQHGKLHDLKQYKGKTVLLVYWVTWCPTCIYEMPQIQSIYQEYGENKGDVIILTMANPVSDAYPKNRDISMEELKKHIKEKGYTFPVLFDTTAKIKEAYSLEVFPSTYLISKEGLLVGVVKGKLSKDQLKYLINLDKK